MTSTILKITYLKPDFPNLTWNNPKFIHHIYTSTWQVLATVEGIHCKCSGNQYSTFIQPSMKIFLPLNLIQIFILHFCFHMTEIIHKVIEKSHLLKKKSVLFYEILIMCSIWRWFILAMTNSNGWFAGKVENSQQKKMWG